MSLRDKKITLLVSGSIAAYKSAELCRELVKAGAKVQVAMSKSATEFITPLTMQTLSKRKVVLDMFDLETESEIGHIKIADSPDLVLLAPATANAIAKAAKGYADDIISTILLATRAPVIIAPAMNVNMWRHPATRENVEILKKRGVKFVGPESGELACGWEGEGRLASLEEILQASESKLAEKDLRGTFVVVTAGPTREPLDKVRFISNHSTGKMGYALAENALSRGANVALVSGKTFLEPPEGAQFYPVENAREMEYTVRDLLSRKGLEDYRYLLMAAAVSDHRPEVTVDGKLKLDKEKSHQISFEPNPDILANVSRDKAAFEQKTSSSIKLIGFALEVGTEEEVINYAKDKLKRKGLDFVVANNAKDALAKDTSKVVIIDSQGNQTALPESTKLKIAEMIIDQTISVEINEF